MSKKNIYLLKDLARQTGNSVYTLKYYYKMGLIREQGRTPFTDFKYFGEGAVKQLLRIRRLRKEDYSIKEIIGKLNK